MFVLFNSRLSLFVTFSKLVLNFRESLLLVFNNVNCNSVMISLQKLKYCDDVTINWKCCYMIQSIVLLYDVTGISLSLSFFISLNRIFHLIASFNQSEIIKMDMVSTRWNVLIKIISISFNSCFNNDDPLSSKNVIQDY